MKEFPYHSIFLENLLATEPKSSKKNYKGKISGYLHFSIVADSSIHGLMKSHHHTLFLS